MFVFQKVGQKNWLHTLNFMKGTDKTLSIFQNYIDHVNEGDKVRYFRQMDQYQQKQISNPTKQLPERIIE